MRLLALAIAMLQPLAAHASEQWQDEPALYFLGEGPETDVTYVHYGAFGSGFETGFAIGPVCEPGAAEEQQCVGHAPQTIIRVVRRLSAASDKSRHDYAWLETSLDACPTARERLMRLPDARWAPHMRIALQPDQQAFEDMRFTTFEGQLTVVTAEAGQQVVNGTMQQLAGAFVYRGNADGSGNPADWGEQMLRDIEPCLKPSSAPPPWTREPKIP